MSTTPSQNTLNNPMTSLTLVASEETKRATKFRESCHFFLQKHPHWKMVDDDFELFFLHIASGFGDVDGKEPYLRNTLTRTTIVKTSTHYIELSYDSSQTRFAGQTLEDVLERLEKMETGDPGLPWVAVRTSCKRCIGSMAGFAAHILAKK